MVRAQTGKARPGRNGEGKGGWVTKKEGKQRNRSQRTWQLNPKRVAVQGRMPKSGQAVKRGSMELRHRTKQRQTAKANYPDGQISPSCPPHTPYQVGYILVIERGHNSHSTRRTQHVKWGT